MSEVTSLSLQKKIPASLRNDFWVALMDTVEEEILTMRTEIDKKKTLFSTSVTDLERLKELGDLVYELDYNFLSVIENLLTTAYGLSTEQVTEFLRQELLKIPFQVKNKALYQVYKSFFNFLNLSFTNRISVYQTTTNSDIFTGNKVIIRDLVPNILTGLEDSFETYNFIDDEDSTLEDSSYLLGFDRPYSSFYRQDVTGDFIGRTKEEFTLDSEEEYLLDDNLVLDASLVELKNPTKHISFEMIADQTFFRYDSTGTLNSYLYTADSAAYLFSGFYYNKKASEVPHIGIQLTFFIDKTGFSNFLTSSLGELNAKAVMNPNVLAEGIVSYNQISYIQFGIGTQEIPEYSDVTPTYPTELSYPIQWKQPYPEERYESASYMGAIGEYIGQSVGGIIFSDLVLGFGYTDLPLLASAAPLKPNTLKMAFVDFSNPDPFSTMMKITDNGYGVLESDYCTGTVDYTTGKISFETSFEKEYRETVSNTGDTYTASFLEEIIPGSYNLVIKIPIPGDGEEIHYVTDDGAGNLVSDYDKFVSGTIAYDVTPTVSIIFTESIEQVDSIEIYRYNYSTSFGAGHKLYLHEVYTENPVQITEAGLFVRTALNPTVDQLLCYMTFPAIEFAYNYYHLNLGVIFER